MVTCLDEDGTIARGRQLISVVRLRHVNVISHSLPSSAAAGTVSLTLYQSESSSRLDRSVSLPPQTLTYQCHHQR
ncbi:hypothetical protein PUN28_017712 [Cardiocondyla obscurior]|uniref:Uncharacterized protein n=1 Tax=Cardiocondyla obscurior TaxID=286306 RepID=A0AAW2EML8_9HYME